MHAKAESLRPVSPPLAMGVRDGGDGLEAVEHAIAHTLGDDPGILEDAARTLCLAPGAKRVRPRMLRLFGEATNAPADGLVSAAVAVELIHSASLLHDDVVDESTQRRGRPTANATYGNDIAVLAGDLVLSLALRRLRPLGADLLGTAIDVVEEMTRGALLEITWRGRADVSLETWRAIALGKTGALFGLAARCAGVLGGEPERAARWNRASRHFGVAFQLADDLGDLIGGQGKDRYADLRERNASYATAAVAAQHETVRGQLAQLYARPIIDAADADRVGSLILASGARELTRVAVDEEVRRAHEWLGRDLDLAPIAAIATWAAHLIDRTAEGGLR